MYVLEGGPRSGQWVDDLPDGYTLAPEAAVNGEPLGLADVPATLAVWREHRPRLRALRPPSG